ncbi:lecithine cholesterol acyltransferase [Tanacetum coccineum]
MEIFSMYGVGIATERAYIYKYIPSECFYIPSQNDTFANSGTEQSCLRNVVFLFHGDETVPTLTAGNMCAKGWRGKTRFDLSCIKQYDMSIGVLARKRLIRMSRREFDQKNHSLNLRSSHEEDTDPL